MDSSKRVEASFDFLQILGTDIGLHIMNYVNDPADVVRASIVSRNWRDFVVTNEFAKALCLKAFPQLADIGIVPETMNRLNDETSADWETLLWDQKIYASLHHAVLKSASPLKDCVITAVSASSTDKLPDESIANTLTSMDRYFHKASYWSSKGTADPDEPETLIYKLRPGVWVISEVLVRPFEAYFQPGNPIYSAQAVRFRLGRMKPSLGDGNDLHRLPMPAPADDKFIWTYTSPEFPMNQENSLQSFKLPEPVVSTGGFMLVELLGRVQSQGSDGLFYVCICHVRAMGRSLSPAFEIEYVGAGRKMMLKHRPEHLKSVLESPPVTVNARAWNEKQQLWWEGSAAVVRREIDFDLPLIGEMGNDGPREFLWSQDMASWPRDYDEDEEEE
ncbi:F-box protein At4g00755-like [Andrographis paniculata]|uniref:F-box protein At4g00755-like n=1 Tax=Andrographis paniculata TaxID=175694 RepID=UPI0021E77921|nr:F-box protein At4g00755-like [Andrographis paniculata]